MDKKKMPQVDAWLSYGAHYGWDDLTLDEAQQQVIEKHGKPTKKQKESFVEGYYRGRVTNATWRATNLFKYISVDQIAAMGNELQLLVAKYEPDEE